MKTARKSWIDILKGIAILLVVYGHVYRGFINSGLLTNISLLEELDKIIYLFHIPLFFIISGYLIKKPLKNNLSKILQSKFIRLMIPYFIWVLILGFLRIIMSEYVNVQVEWSFLYEMLYEPMFQYWFLYILFITMILFLLLNVYLDSTIILGIVILLKFFNINFWILDDIVFYMIFLVLGNVIMKYGLIKFINLKYAVVYLFALLIFLHYKIKHNYFCLFMLDYNDICICN